MLFFLDDTDTVLAARRRGDHSRLGLALRLVTVPFLRPFLTDPLECRLRCWSMSLGSWGSLMPRR